jgi:DNA-binding LytR/AlgR family response regulator
MLHVAIVEDDPVIRAWLKEKLIGCFSASRAAAEFDLFASGDAFLSMASDHYSFDAVFLDIEMPGISGIETARRLLSIQPEALTIFVSGREDLVYDTFAVRPFRFLPKSRLEEMLPDTAEALLAELGSMREQTLVFSDASGDVFSFSLRKIIYIEARNKDCRIVTAENETLVRCRLMDIEDKLPEGSFIKIHRSYIVNASSIYYIGKQSVSLTTGENLPLARNRADEVRREFLRFAGGA